MESLRAVADESKKTRDEFMKAKAKRIEECKMKFTTKCKELRDWYFDDTNEDGIVRSVNRAIEKYGGRGRDVDLYMNFRRPDFCGWNKFVPFQPDQYGNNYNARPSSCLKLFLDDCKEKGYLENIEYDVWGNRKFTVKFTICIIGYDKEKVDTDMTNSAGQASSVLSGEATTPISVGKSEISDEDSKTEEAKD